jgi:hypothetical protein
MSKRINVMLPERSVDRLETLKEKTDAGSITEVIKHALMTYESIAQHLERGVTFFGQGPDGKQFSVEFMIDVKRKSPELRVVG